MFWKRSIFCLLSSLFVAGSALAGTWQEKAVVPAEYEKIEYASNGSLFWLKKPKEKNPVQYFHTQEGMKELPTGMERGEGDGVFYTSQAYNGYDKSTAMLIQVAQKDKRSQQGLVDLSGNTVVPIGNYKSFTVYNDGYTIIGDTLYKDGSAILTQKGIWRRTTFPDAWSANGSANVVFNHIGTKVMDLPFVEKNWVPMYPDMIIGKSNGKDGKPKGYRVWNLSMEDITPVGQGFKDLVILRTSTPREGLTSQQIYGLFGRTDAGWSVYPYLGGTKFGEEIKIAAKEKEYFSCSEVAPGYYRLGRPQENGDYLLDINGKVVRQDANGINVKNKVYTQEKWRVDKFFMPFAFGFGSTYFVTGGMIQADGGHFVRLRDEGGKEFATLWDYVFLGNDYIMNRNDGKTQIMTYKGEVVKTFPTSKEGYFPLAGKQDEIEEDGKVEGYTDVDFSNWPGNSRYQPYNENGDWGIWDMDGAQVALVPDMRYGKIVVVSNDGKHFWSYFDQGGKLQGIKQFDWVE